MDTYHVDQQKAAEKGLQCTNKQKQFNCSKVTEGMHSFHNKS